jgi:hypothetical protein
VNREERLKQIFLQVFALGTYYGVGVVSKHQWEQCKKEAIRDFVERCKKEFKDHD